MPTILDNSNISLAFDFTKGISLVDIFDPVANRHYLRNPTMLFEFAVNSGPPQESATGLSVLMVETVDTSSLVAVATSISNPSLKFELQVSLQPGSSVAALQLSAYSSEDNPIFLRVVFPKIFGVTVPGGDSALMGAVPQEAGWVAPLSEGVTLGMPFDKPWSPLAPRVGLPIAYNNMEVASVFDGSHGGGVFFCDLDGDLENGIPPLQFNLSKQAAVAFWIGNVSKSSPGILSRLGIGVHPEGDWHAAVDFYTSVHRPRWTFPQTPEWFADAPAIYSPTGLTGGGIYLCQPTSFLADGAVWNTWEDNDREWSDGKTTNPVQITPGGFAPAGTGLAAVMQNSQQVDVFSAGWDGAIWVTWQSGNGFWRNNRHGLAPERITPPGMVTPGAPLASGQQGNDQLDVFFAGNNGAVYVTWERGDMPWTDGVAGRRTPAQIGPSNFVRPGSHLAAAKETNQQLDLFVIRKDGAIWFNSVVDYQPWDVWTRITPRSLFPAGAPIVAIQGINGQMNVYAVSTAGAILRTSRAPGQAWATPIALTSDGFAYPDAHLAAAKRSDLEVDIFLVRSDGAIWMVPDGVQGSPRPVSTPNLASGGAPVAVARQGASQWDAFVVANDGAIWVTWLLPDGNWTDGQQNRPTPEPVTPNRLAPPSSDVAALARSESHVDAFVIASGRIRSFLEMEQFFHEAKALQTNIVYLTDYWEGADEGNGLPFWNKGDYYPRADLGGEPAFIQGIEAIHQSGGKVILYVEPFIIYKFSDIGKSKGEDWAGRDENGIAWEDYGDCYSMVAPFPEWQQHVIDVVTRLRSYGADGIFLDSYAWQMNRPMRANAEGKWHTAQEYARGVLNLTDAVRAVPSLFNTHIVMGETTAGPIAHHWDGGVNADFGFDNLYRQAPDNICDGNQRLIASPVRYGIPEVRMFGNGKDLNGLQQFYAAGHGLALCSYWPGSFMHDSGGHIAKLVQLRSEYKDALIYGAQISQPKTDNADVIAYLYQGVRHRLMTLVHVGSQNAVANVTLGAPDSHGLWVDLLTTDEFSAPDGVVRNVSFGPDEKAIRVLLHRQRIGNVENFEGLARVAP